MTNKRERERLSSMFADLEVLTVKPGMERLEVAPLALPAPLEEPLLVPEPAAIAVPTLEIATEEFPTPPEQVLPELAPGEVKAETGLERAPPLPEVTLITLPTFPPPEPVPEESAPARPAPQPVRVNKPASTGLTRFGIGLLTGLLVTGVILAATYPLHIFHPVGRVALLVWEIFCGLVGAAVARNATRREIWVGALQGTLVPLWIALVIGAIVYLLMYTSFFG